VQHTLHLPRDGLARVAGATTNAGGQPIVWLYHALYAMTPIETITSACTLLSAGNGDAAAAEIRQHYPFDSKPLESRSYTEVQSTSIFRRDGFLDRYSGERLVFPGALRLLSIRMPEVFPYHPNWKTSKTHPAYWRLSPTVDHVVPVTRGGEDVPANWVTTSMLRNSAKGNWLLEELGWALHVPGDSGGWDGLMPWFVEQVEADRSLLANSAIRRWYRASQQLR
jgi:hypothetical protein